MFVLVRENENCTQNLVCVFTKFVLLCENEEPRHAVCITLLGYANSLSIIFNLAYTWFSNAHSSSNLAELVRLEIFTEMLFSFSYNGNQFRKMAIKKIRDLLYKTTEHANHIFTFIQT